MSNNRLSVIIPFLNEGKELENTIVSVIKNSDENIDIIIINDNSDDGYDYSNIAKKYNIKYLINNERKGPAFSREKGVQASLTPYFLLIDAHMRFHNKMWISAIIDELTINPKSLLCCQTSGFLMIGDKYIDRPFTHTTFGTRLIFNNDEDILGFEWLKLIHQELLIPNVLGACYACSKIYWNYIKGLNGLKQWGSEEPYLSLKVWLTGGVCKILPHIKISHLYRDTPPYTALNKFIIYNKLFVAKTILPPVIFNRYKSYFRHNAKALYNEVLTLLQEEKETIEELKTYYKQIFIKEYSDFIYINDLHSSQQQSYQKIMFLTEIINNKKDTITKNGLLNGKLGLSIFYFHLGYYLKSDVYTSIAEELLDEIIEIPKFNGYSINEGIIGLGWTICYLTNKKFINCDTDEALCDIDILVEDLLAKHVASENHINEYLLGDIIIYTRCRLLQTSQKHLFRIKNALDLIIIKHKKNKNKIIPHLLDAILSYEDYSETDLSIYDVMHLYAFDEKAYNNNIPLSLNGYAGYLLRVILDP